MLKLRQFTLKLGQCKNTKTTNSKIKTINAKTTTSKSNTINAKTATSKIKTINTMTTTSKIKTFNTKIKTITSKSRSLTQFSSRPTFGRTQKSVKTD